MDDLSIMGALKVILKDIGIETNGGDSFLLFKAGPTSIIRIEEVDSSLKISYIDRTNIRPEWSRTIDLMNPFNDPLETIINELKSYHLIPDWTEIPELKEPSPKKLTIKTRNLDI